MLAIAGRRGLRYTQVFRHFTLRYEDNFVSKNMELEMVERNLREEVRRHLYSKWHSTMLSMETFLLVGL